MSVPDVFYALPDDVSQDKLILRGAERHHLKDVYRKKIGDIILVVNGLGTAWTCKIGAISAENVTAKITTTHPEYGEPHTDLTLAVAVPKKDKFEWILAKTTELGVNCIVPLITKRTIVTPADNKSQRWRKIMIGAMKQCRRARLPSLLPPVSFEQFVTTKPDQTVRLLAHEKAATTARLSSMLRDAVHAKKYIVCIGPEGGFSALEIELATANSFVIFSLGARRLRTETAAIAAVTLIMDKCQSEVGA